MLEIGGTPVSAPRAYAERSPLTYARQSGLLYDRIRKLNPRASVLESVGVWPHDGDLNARTKLPAALLAFGLLPLPRSPETAFRYRAGAGSAAARRSVPGASCVRAPTGGSLLDRVAVAASSYEWPLKPFDVQHPIRGNFGDPRTLFRLSSPGDQSPEGRFTFHDGVDIVGKPGEPAYPVVSGTVVVARGDRISVRRGSGSSRTGT